MLDEDLLNILACPETKQVLHFADTGLIERLNMAMDAGRLRNRKGDIVIQRMEAGLVREDGKFLYPIRDEIPILMIEEAIPLVSVESPKASVPS